MELEMLVTPGLGDNTYVVASGGEAAVIDPQRDVRRYVELLASRKLRLRWILETHVHNDYVSGALELAAATGAEIAAPAGGQYAFGHRSLSEGDDVTIGDVRLMAMETPGHTPEHLSYLAYQAGREHPVAVFTGGSLMVGSAGRTDLLGPELTTELTRAQFRTLHRLAALPDEVQVLPTHGAGSFCGAGPAPKNRTSTMGEERAANRALAAPDEESFVEQQLSGLLSYPTYYRAMAPINRAGPRVAGQVPVPPPLSPQEVERRIAGGALLIDARDRRAFGAGHIPGALNVELDDAFASYVGWLVPFEAPMILALPEPAPPSLEEAATQLFRIGYERVEGWLEGGVEAWRAGGRPLRSYAVAGLDEFCREYRRGRVGQVLDVRQQREWDAGHIPDSQHVFVGDLPERVAEVRASGTVWTICATGHRSSMAASLLDREGIPVALVGDGGVLDFLRRCMD
jgi:glyoxylase-like metal-dependent hydrolase (beta-lactamase superfamily II)